MTDLSQILSEPIAWTNWDQDADLLAFLSDLQANILKGHGRDHTANIFLSFEGMTAAEIKQLLQKISFLTTSALDQLRSAEAFKLTGVSGGRIVCTFLSQGAYAKLGTAQDEIPDNAAFRAGMRGRGQLSKLRFDGIDFDFDGLADTPIEGWESTGPWSPGNAAPDAMILVADDERELVTRSVEAVQGVINGSGAKQLGIDIGLAQRRVQDEGDEKGEGIEHFGYVDGRSQPLFLQEQLAKEPATKWSPSFPPSQFVVPDPAECTAVSCGSYFVYRKLEQDVKRFKDQEDLLAAEFTKQGVSVGERAGALVVGRFEDGTPVIEGAPIAGKPGNDFNYEAAGNDPLTTGCPFKAHIRKTNPRGNSPGERGRIMARRGITYGVRMARGEDGDFAENDRPSTGVGLIFMAYMADIAEQFEFTQAAWAGNAGFEKPDTGIDAVIGQQSNTTPGHKAWFDKTSGKTAEFDFKTSVKLVGGDYFFAPSLSFLQRG